MAIIWTNADPIHWRIYAALGRDELNKACLKPEIVGNVWHLIVYDRS